jgi:ribosomal protein S18 acetylase RimI-like enzyme
MDTLLFSEDRAFAKSFYDHVERNLCYEVCLESGEGVRRRAGLFLNLFTIPGKFLGCHYVEREGRVAGLVCLTEQGGKAYVDSCYVAEKYRRQGVAFQLLKAACDRLFALGKSPIHLLIVSRGMKRLVDKLPCQEGLHKEVRYDQSLEDLGDFLFTPSEIAPE